MLLLKSSESSNDEQASLLCPISVVRLGPRGRVSIGMQPREKSERKKNSPKKNKSQVAGNQSVNIRQKADSGVVS